MQPLIFIILFIVAIILTLLLVVIPLRKNKLTAGLLTFFVTLGMVAGYQYWGSASKWLAYEDQKQKQMEVKHLLQTMKGTSTLIQKLKQKVRETPEDPKGWYLLGRLYANQQAWPLAVQAFKKAHRLNSDDDATTVNYGQALWQKNKQVFNQEIRDLFQHLLDKTPNQPDALAMLALDYHAQGNFEKAIVLWESLLMQTMPQSEEATAIREAIAQASRKLQVQ